jgi:hypothetical protein
MVRAMASRLRAVRKWVLRIGVMVSRLRVVTKWRTVRSTGEQIGRGEEMDAGTEYRGVDWARLERRYRYTDL